MTRNEQRFYRLVNPRALLDELLNFEVYANQGKVEEGRIGVSFYDEKKCPIPEGQEFSRVEKFYFTREKIRGQWVPRICAIVA